MPNEIVLHAQVQLTNDPQPMLEQQIIILMNAAGLRVFDGNDAGIRLAGFDSLENQIERLTRQQFDAIAEEASSGNFAVSSSFALKGYTWRVSFGHFGGLGEPRLEKPMKCSIAAHV
jgi:hypothetical protein